MGAKYLTVSFENYGLILPGNGKIANCPSSSVKFNLLQAMIKYSTLKFLCNRILGREFYETEFLFVNFVKDAIGPDNSKSDSSAVTQLWPLKICQA